MAQASAKKETAGTTKERKYKFHTVKIPRVKNEPKYLPINIIGTTKAGEPVEISLLIERGVAVHNIPDAAIEALSIAVEKTFSQVEKPDKSGMEWVEEKQLAYDFAILASYDERK